LTSGAVNALQANARYRSLIGRFRDPDDHLEDDCRVLETDRLLGVEGELLRATLEQIDTRMKNMETTLSTLVQLLQAKLQTMKVTRQAESCS